MFHLFIELVCSLGDGTDCYLATYYRGRRYIVQYGRLLYLAGVAKQCSGTAWKKKREGNMKHALRQAEQEIERL